MRDAHCAHAWLYIYAGDVMLPGSGMLQSQVTFRGVNGG